MDDTVRLTTEPMEWDWDQTISKAESIWGNLVDDLEVKRGDFSELISRIARRVGLSEAEVTVALNQTGTSGLESGAEGI